MYSQVIRPLSKIMSTKRKSAFSVYAETKPEPKLDEIQSKLIDTTNTKKSGNKKNSPQDNLKKSKPNGKQVSFKLSNLLQ